MTTQIDDFLGLVLRSGLLTSSGLRDACSDFCMDRGDDVSLDEFCQHLIANNALTKWQCDKLRKGKWKGFYFDDYCFLEHLSRTDTTTTFLAKEVASDKRVAITFTPPDLINYMVNELGDTPPSGDR